MHDLSLLSSCKHIMSMQKNEQYTIISSYICVALGSTVRTELGALPFLRDERICAPSEVHQRTFRSHVTLNAFSATHILKVENSFYCSTRALRDNVL